MISFEIPGPPQGKARARVTRWGTYTPDKTLNYEALVKQIYTYEAKGPIHEGPLKIHIHAYYEIPKSTSNKKQEAMLRGEILPTKKPDFDNIAKIICDALNKIAYHDDSQIVIASFQKKYSRVPRVEVILKEVVTC